MEARPSAFRGAMLKEPPAALEAQYENLNETGDDQFIIIAPPEDREESARSSPTFGEPLVSELRSEGTRGSHLSIQNDDRESRACKTYPLRNGGSPEERARRRSERCSQFGPS